MRKRRAQGAATHIQVPLFLVIVLLALIFGLANARTAHVRDTVATPFAVTRATLAVPVFPRPVLPRPMLTRSLLGQRRGNVGYLSQDTSEGVPRTLPLFAEPSVQRRHRYNYHTTSDTREHMSVRLPISFKERDCTDEVACDELYTGDSVTVSGYSAPFVVRLYEY